MIRTLRRKFIIIASLSILLILSVVLICLNAISYYSGYMDSMSLLSFIADNNGLMPEENPSSSDVDFFVSRELRFETRYFSVIIDDDGEYIESNSEHIAAITQEEAETMCSDVLSRKREKGRLNRTDSVFVYKIKTVSGEELNDTLYSSSDMSFSLDDDAEYQLVIFMDCTNRFHRISSLRNLSIFIGIVCLVIFVILVSVLSKRAVQPVAENYEKQKQFITNAGHELKTPLAIINANAEVMEVMNGKSEWTQSTRNQVERLTGLVNDLISMAKLDEAAERGNIEMSGFDVSAIASTLANDFRTVAARQGKTLDSDIAPDLSMNGNEKMIRELISIMLDNAVKYCDDNGKIRVELVPQKNYISLIVSNSYAEKTDCKRFFERFYREDTSHNSEKSGYGIGLSMAENIVKLHKGKITASQKNSMVCFTIQLPW